MTMRKSTKPVPGWVTIPGLRWEAIRYRTEAAKAQAGARCRALLRSAAFTDAHADEIAAWETAVADMGAMDAFTGRGDPSRSVWA